VDDLFAAGMSVCGEERKQVGGEHEGAADGELTCSRHVASPCVLATLCSQLARLHRYRL